MIPQSASVRREADRKNVEEVEHFPSEQDDGNNDNENGQDLAEIQAAFLLEAAGAEAHDIQRGKSKYQRPENVVDLFSGSDEQKDRRQSHHGRLVKAAGASRPIVGLTDGKQEG